MAQIVEKISSLEENVKVLKKANGKRYKWAFLSLGIGFLFAAVTNVGFFAAIAILTWFGFIVSTATNSKKIKIYKRGIKGEQSTVKVLSQLPDEYTVFSDITVKFDQRPSQIDHIVVGPNGIFVVETKNWNGDIMGTDRDQKVIQYKIGRQGGSYNIEHYNPVKQVNTHVYRLASFLKENGHNVWVEGTVLFTNSQAVVALSSENTRVFTFDEIQNGMFLDFIQDFSRKPLPENKRKEIVQLLSTL